jgi:hypothetical protein
VVDASTSAAEPAPKPAPAPEPLRDALVRVRPDGHLRFGLRVPNCPGLDGGTLWVAPGAEVRVSPETATYLFVQHASELDLRRVE